MITIHIPRWEIPSQNKRETRHWSKNHKEMKWLTAIVRAHMAADDICMPGHFRYVEIMSWRSKRITDDANYRGGAKGAVDALKNAGAICDDKDKLAKIEYKQDLRSKSPIKGKPYTIIRVSAEPIKD